jgi:prephenate dehydratase
VWHGRAEAIPARTFAEAIDELVSGRVQWAVIPISNSTIGPVAPARAALRACSSAITIIRGVDVPVRHCLLALPGTSIADIRFVGSHPVALAQCTRLFADRPELMACAAFDTAGAAREVSMFHDRARRAMSELWYASLPVDGPSQLAAIASENAGRRYGLSILRDGVQDDPSNVTRFVVVRAREPRRW